VKNRWQKGGKVSNREFLNEGELEALGIRKKRTLQKDRLSGRGPRYYKIGGAIRYRRSDIEAWLAACAREPRRERGATT
jgi:hypothetical protein